MGKWSIRSKVASFAFLFTLALRSQTQDVVGRAGRPKAIVDVDDGDTTATAVQHTKERSEPPKLAP